MNALDESSGRMLRQHTLQVHIVCLARLHIVNLAARLALPLRLREGDAQRAVIYDVYMRRKQAEHPPACSARLC